MTKIVHSEQAAAEGLQKSVVTIGNFDGMHIGHQAIFETAVREARERDALPVALTFEPHPEAFFRPDDAPLRLSPPPYKYELMGACGVEWVVSLPFDAALANCSPEEFVERILAEKLGAVHVVVGEDFRFGKKRAGDTDSLQRLGAAVGMSTTVASFVEWDGEPVSSTRIRAAVADGEMASVETMLNRPYRLYGEVVAGEQRGRKLGFPTANLDVVDMASPPSGVYITTLGRADQEQWTAITNIGTRPTFDDGEQTVETFILDDAVDDDLDLYGDAVELDIFRRVRGEREFESPEQLVAQIQRDIEEARAFFAREDFDGGR